MYLIVGLGNPERKYENTKHNCGFMAVEELIDHYSIPSSGISMKGMYGKTMIDGEKVIVMKPLTYMNLSGQAVRAFVDYYGIDPETQLLVIYDDIDLDVGSIRVRKQGSAGSHNGMKSIIQCLGTQKFARVRIGIGAKPPKWDLADYVLAPFSKADRETIDETIREIVPITEWFVKGEIDRAMEKYNKKKEIDGGPC